MGEILDFKERSRLRRFLYAKPTILVLMLGTLGLAHATWGMYEKYRDAVVKREKAEMELHTMKNRIGELEANIANLSTERGLEEKIRDRFMVAKEGEQVLIITDPPEPTEQTVIVVPNNNVGIFQKLKSALGLGQ